MLKPAFYRRMKRNLFRVHCQFVSANDRRAPTTTSCCSAALSQLRTRAARATAPPRPCIWEAGLTSLPSRGSGEGTSAENASLPLDHWDLVNVDTLANEAHGNIGHDRLRACHSNVLSWPPGRSRANDELDSGKMRPQQVPYSCRRRPYGRDPGRNERPRRPRIGVQPEARESH